MKKYSLNVFLYIFITFALLQGLWLLTVPAVVWFIFRAPAWWLLPIVFLLDGYFGTFHNVPTLSIVMIFVVLVVELLRPQLLWRRQGV